MEKIKIELTDKEFNAISVLLAAYKMHRYRKAVGGDILVESNVRLMQSTDRALLRLNKKINS